MRNDAKSKVGVTWRARLTGLILCLLAPWSSWGAEPVPAVSAGGVTIEFNAASRTLKVSHAQAGAVLDRLVVRAEAGGRKIASNDADLKPSPAADVKRGELTVTLQGGAALKTAVRDGRVEVRLEGDVQGPASLEARACLGGEAIPGFVRDETPADKGVIVTTLGRATVPGAGSLFYPERDVALTASSSGTMQWKPFDKGWQLACSAPAGQPLLMLRIQPHYYRDTLGIKYYAPRPRQRRWPTAPVVAMTWYGIEGWNNRPAQTKEWLFPQIDWVAEHLLPYAGPNLVFQLDDNYPQNDDKAMRELSDYIRSKGLVPGIWFTPFTVAPKAEAEKRPDWFLHDKGGKLIPTFGGVNWGGNLTLNVTRPEAVEAWFGMWWKKASETWSFDFFKIDGEPEVIEAYRRAADGRGVDGYRKGLKIGRSVVGPEKFINGCWGTPVEAIGFVNGSRTGGDTGNDPHAIDVVLRWNFLNNVAWWSDPDAAANLHKAPVERVRLNAQARVLTGQQFLTDDVWTKVPPAVCRVWQQSFPSLDIRPGNFYPVGNLGRYDLFDLRIAKPWATWDVVGLFNYDGRAAEKTLDLGRLPLNAAEVHVFDYWRNVYLGRFPRDAKLPAAMAAFEGRLFCVAPALDDRPVLVSTSRHLSQGGLDLERVAWKQDGSRWMVSGKSTHLVKGDPYELVFAAGRLAAEAGTSSGGKVALSRGGGVVRATLVPDAGGAADWEVVFVPITEGLLDVTPQALELAPGATGDLALQNLGPKPARFSLQSSDPRVRFAPREGEVGPWPAKAKVAVSVDVRDVELGKALTARVTVETAGAPPSRVEVLARAPQPVNLAREAKATASSIWSPGYEAAKAIDGSPATRWNSGLGDKEGCWIELAWEKPVRFDRVVIDECMDYGPRIQAWKLLAGDSDSQIVVIANGDGMGARHAVDLPNPVETQRLRLLIEKASTVPTIWEIEVNQGKGPADPAKQEHVEN